MSIISPIDELELKTPEELGLLLINVLDRESFEQADVELLLEIGANVNMKNEFYDTPLHLAAKKGHLKTVRLLLEHGADINAKNNIGTTPLRLVSIHGHLEIVKLMLDRKWGIDMKNRGNIGCLSMASWYGHLEIVKHVS